MQGVAARLVHGHEWLSPSGDRGVEKTADEPGPTQPLVLSDLNMRWDLPDHIEECGAAALAAHLRGSHASGCVKNHPEQNITGVFDRRQLHQRAARSALVPFQIETQFTLEEVLSP